MHNKLKNAIAFSIIPQILLVKWLGSYPGLIESAYSKGFYPYWSGFFRSILGWLPFSMGDLLYGFLIVSLIVYLVKRWKYIFSDWKTLVRDFAMVLSVAYFTFHISWGFNYYREPIATVFNLEENNEFEDLITVTEALIWKTNDLQYRITRDSSEIVRLPYDQKEIFGHTLDAFDRFSQQYAEMRYAKPSLKKSLFSTLLTYMGYGGYLNPFTHEAQVNSRIPNFRFPVVCAHEVSHQLGYSAENEANFIGYIIMASHPDIHLQYSANAYALSHCLSTIRSKDKERYELFYGQLNEGVQKNYLELKAFWESYKNPMEPIFKSVFNTFLKVNNQKAGIKSYSLVVPLIVGYHKKYLMADQDRPKRSF